MSYAEKLITRTLDAAGVQIDGPNPWDIRVHDRRFFTRVLRDGSLGAGESYVDGWWDCDQLDELAARVLRSEIDVEFGGKLRMALATVLTRLFNRQAGARASAVADMHYNQQVDLFESMLGPTMNYSCAYWRRARTLDDAQRDKMALICRKLELKPGMRLLDIGCGWGGFARYAAEQVGCSVVGVTISPRQADDARRRCSDLPVRVLCCDYRAAEVRSAGPFDAVVSIGMFEHVGRKNFKTFFDVCRDVLPDGGLLLLQTFGREGDCSVDPWTDRYIFPNSYLPTIGDVGTAAHGRLVMEDWHNFGADYDRTLMAWWSRFERWAARQSPPPGERFHRTWRYYLLTYAGCFRTRTANQLWQIVLSNGGRAGGYDSVRTVDGRARRAQTVAPRIQSAERRQPQRSLAGPVEAQPMGAPQRRERNK